MIFWPLVLDLEAEYVAVEGKASCEVGNNEFGDQGIELQHV
jgi:hypothetical protein